MTSHYFWLLLHSLSRFLVQVFRTIVTNHEPTPTQRHRVHWKTTLKSYFLLTFSTRFNIFTITLHIPSTKYFLCLPLATLYKQLHLSNIATFLKISWVENTKKNQRVFRDPVCAYCVAFWKNFAFLGNQGKLFKWGSPLDQWRTLSTHK